MIRLWSRSGLRVLSVMALVLALVAGGYLSTDRHHQQMASASSVQTQLDLAYQQRIMQEQQAAYLAAIPGRAQLVAAQAAAQAAAQKQAAAAAAAGAAKAQRAQDAARKQHTQTANRSSTRKAPVTSTPKTSIPKSCSAYSGNRAIGCSLLLSAGFGLSQMPCLDKMWTRESNWRTTAENPSSHSYGIPQALPANKMAAYGSDYRTNPVPQIKWGLHYIQGRYNTPCGAWSFWQAHSWY